MSDQLSELSFILEARQLMYNLLKHVFYVEPGSLPAPPWESAYLSEDRLLFQESTLEVRKAYLKYNYMAKILEGFIEVDGILIGSLISHLNQIERNEN